MKMDGLVRYGVPGELIALWKARESEKLLPVQELAVKRYGIFDDGNLLIQAPTSSGKTFIGEMAAVQTALRRKKVVYLVPLKALAEEKYRDFKEKYEAYGIRVIISTRDHREFDRDLEEGRFSIAVVVYEKLSQLLVRRPERLEEIELIIADELELLSDPERGGMAELLMTRIVQSTTRLVGLSAVIGQAEKLAEWMRAKLLMYERRPVELRFGVLHEGVFRYRTYNEYSEAEEILSEAGAESTWPALMENVSAFAEQGETSLVFVKSKHEARHGAESLAERVHESVARETIDALSKLDRTRARETLMKTLHSGVAFHSADLSPDERVAVEQGFRSGEIRVMVSTSTLAVGLNMPARNVFISAEKWRYDQRFGMPWKSPILRSEYENMGGRAGRYGAGQEFGRSLLVASNAFDQETLWRRYIEGEREGIEPRLAKEPLENYVLRLVAARTCRTKEELLDFLESTPSGQWVWQEQYSIEEIELRIRAAVNRASDAGMLAINSEELLEATPLGQAVATKGISMATAKEMEEWIVESEHRNWEPIDMLVAAAMTPDGRNYAVSLTTQEHEESEYLTCLKAAVNNDVSTANVPLARFANSTVSPFFEEVRAIKVALILNDWIDQAPVNDLEERYQTMSGQILAAADQVSWLIDAAAAMAKARGCEAAFVERLETLSERVQRGLREEALILARIGEPGISRSAIAALVDHNLHTPEALAETRAAVLAQWVSKRDAQRLRKWAQGQRDQGGTPRTPPRGGAALVIDERNPGEVQLDGARVALQDKQFRLIQLLAATPGDCVSYETIYDTLWGVAIVENNQMHFQKRKLVQAIKATVPERAEVIRTVPKRGFVLELGPDDVTLVTNRETVAA